MLRISLYNIRKRKISFSAFQTHDLISIIAVFFFLISIAFAQAGDGRLLSDSWPIVDSFRELELRGEIPIVRNVWPDRSGEVQAVLPDSFTGDAAQFWATELRKQLIRTSIKHDTLRFFIEPGTYAILNNPRDPDDRFYPTLRLGGGMKKGMLEGFVTYVVNLRWANEENYRGRQWEGFAGRPDQVYIRTGGDDWGIKFGKDYLSWGEGLILGRAHDPFERLDYELELGPFHFSGFTGFLDPYRFREPMADSTVVRWANRYLTGHRLEFV